MLDWVHVSRSGRKRPHVVERRNRKYGKKWRVALAKKGEGGSAGKNLSSHPRNRVWVSASSRTQVLARPSAKNYELAHWHLGTLSLCDWGASTRQGWLRRTNRELNISETAETKEEVMVTETRTNNVRPRELARG